MKIHRVTPVALSVIGLTLPCAAQTWVATSAPGFGDPLNSIVGSVAHDGYLYAATENAVQGAEVWRTDGVAAWAPSSLQGFGDPNNRAVVSSVAFGGRLVVLTRNDASGVEAWSFDGAAWSQTNTDGFGDPGNGVGELFVLGGSLYAATINLASGCGVHRFNGGTSWTTIGSSGLGNTNNYEADLEFLAGSLYAGTGNFVTGCEVRRFTGGTNWARVDPGSGFDASGSDNEYAGVYTYANALYVGTYNESSGTEVWEYLGGTSWVQRNADGFGDPRNVDIEPALEFGGTIYIGTVSEATAGGEVWRYDGGSSFVQVSSAGFGSPANQIVLFLVEHEGSMYASTANVSSGAEVWRYEAGMTWSRVDPGAPGGGGFGDPSNLYADLDVLGGELFATPPSEVWRMAPSEIGTSFCAPGTPNSSGGIGRVVALGREIVAANDLALTAESLPQNSFGFFIVSRAIGSSVTPPGSVGLLCLTGSIGRYVGPGQVQNSGGAGAFSLQLDLTLVPQPNGFVAATAGETWSFQAWHRDVASGTVVSNFTEGLSVTFR